MQNDDLSRDEKRAILDGLHEFEDILSQRMRGTNLASARSGLADKARDLRNARFKLEKRWSVTTPA
jgi:hypothetical protein